MFEILKYVVFFFIGFGVVFTVALIFNPKLRGKMIRNNKGVLLWRKKK